MSTATTASHHQREPELLGQTVAVIGGSAGIGLKGWFLGLVVGTIGKGVLEKAFKNSVKAIEARNGTAEEAGAA